MSMNSCGYDGSTKRRTAFILAIALVPWSVGCGRATDPAAATEKKEPAATQATPGAQASVSATDFARRSAALGDTLARFMAPTNATVPPSRARLADELVLLIQLALDNQRLMEDVEKELNGPETGYFLARLEALREETNRRNAQPEPAAEHWTRIFDGVNLSFSDNDQYQLDPFEIEPFRPLQSELGEVPAVMGSAGGSNNRSERLNITLLLLRKHEPELAPRLERNLIPEVASVLFVERMNYLGYSVYPVLAREIPPPEKVPPVDDRGRACAAFLKRFITEVVPVYRAKAAIELEMQFRAPAYEQLHQQVLGNTMEGFLQVREDSTDTDPLLAWRDLVREFHPERLNDVAAMILFLTAPTIDRNQSNARGYLADVYRAQRTFYDKDVDRNGTADYWTADVSGLQRLLVDDAPIALLDESLTSRDARPLPDGPTLEKKSAADPTAPKPGYLLAAVKFNADGKPLAPQEVGSPAPGRNAERFAVCAYPRTYGRTGRQTYLITEDGKIRYKDTEGEPVDRLPKNFDNDDWTTTEDSVAAMTSGISPRDYTNGQVDVRADTPAGLVRLLAHRDLKTAQGAASQIVDRVLYGDSAARAVLRQSLPQLTQALRRPSWVLRSKIARMLAELGSEAAEAVSALCEALVEDDAIKNSSDNDHYFEAATEIALTLGKIGIKNDAVVQKLLEVVVFENPSVRCAAIWSLSALNGPQPNPGLRSILVEDFKPLLVDPTIHNVDQVYRAARVAAWFDPPAVELLDTLLQGLPRAASYWDYHPTAAAMVAAVEKTGESAKLRLLLTNLCDEHRSQSFYPGGIGAELHFAVRQFSSSHPRDPDAIGTMVRAIKTIYGYGESEAVELFGEAFRLSGGEASPPLVFLIYETPQLFIEGVGIPPKKPYRRIAMGVLIKTVGETPDADRTALGMLSDPYLGDLAVDLLTAAKRDDSLAILRESLLLLKNDERGPMKHAQLFTAEGIVRLGGKFDEAREIYEKLLTDELLTADVMHSLRRIGKAAGVLAPLLRQAAAGEGATKQNDPEWSLYNRIVAARALWSVVGDREVALRTASLVLMPGGAQNSQTLEEAIRLLGDLGPAAAEQIPILVGFFRDRDTFDEGFVELVMRALTAMGPAARDPLQALVQDYHYRNALIYRCAVHSLKTLDAAQTKAAKASNSRESSP